MTFTGGGTCDTRTVLQSGLDTAAATYRVDYFYPGNPPITADISNYT
ncbi:MAG: hypothetical protein ABI567_05745 [Gammaproteobacteria bacterium]